MAYSVDVAAYFHICSQHGVTFLSSVQSKNKKVYLWESNMNLGKEGLVSVEQPYFSSGASDGQKLLCGALTYSIWSTTCKICD